MTRNKYTIGPAPSTRNSERNKLLIQLYNLKYVNYFHINNQVNSDSPNNTGLDLDEDHQELAKEFINRDSDLIHRQSDRISKVIAKSQSVFIEELDNQKNNKQPLTNSQKQEIVQNYNEMSNIELENARQDISQIIATRDDVLSINDGRLRNDEDSDYQSDFESQTSLDLFNGLDAQDVAHYNKLDTIAERSKNEFASFVNQIPEIIPNESLPAESSANNSLKRGLDEDEDSSHSNKKQKFEVEAANFPQDSSEVHQTEFDPGDPYDEF